MKSVLKERLLKICDVAMLCSNGEVSIFKILRHMIFGI